MSISEAFSLQLRSAKDFFVRHLWDDDDGGDDEDDDDDGGGHARDGDRLPK